MKKLFKGLIITSCLLTVLVGMSGCSIKDTETEVTDEVEELETTLSDDLTAMETEALEDVDKIQNLSTDELKEAVNYIHDHIEDPVATKEIAKKMYYYSSYIVALVDKKGIEVDHDIYKTALDLKDYINSIYTGEYTDEDEDMVNIKSRLADYKNRLDEDKDSLIEEFYNLIK